MAISEFRLTRRVHFHETDAAGIVHFSVFFRYMEEAEHAMWRAAGLRIATPDAPIGFPRVATSFDFLKPLRFEDEFVRHKILDAIGDLALVGYPVIGHLVAHRGGHELHAAFAEKLLQESDAWRVVESPAGEGAAADASVSVKAPTPVTN